MGVGLGVGIPVLLGALAGIYFLFKKRMRSPVPVRAPAYYPSAGTATTFQTIQSAPLTQQSMNVPLGQSMASNLGQSMSIPLGQSMAGQGLYPLAQSNALGQSMSANRSQTSNILNTCMACQGPDANMLTSCGHKFHVQCMMTRMRQTNQGCPACGYKNFYVLKGDN